MPHCIIEHSSALVAADLLAAVYQGAVKSQLFDHRDIKSRALSYEQHHSGDGITAFVHVSVRILSGRDVEQKAELSHAILQELVALNFSATSLTVEILDIEKASYAKSIV